MATQLAKTIALLYKMQADDIAELETQLLEQRKKVWVQTMTDNARRHGVNTIGNAPRREDLAELKRLSRLDAQSIADTWNRDVLRRIDAIFKETPTANRNTYFRRLEDWAKERGTWKNAQVSLMTETTTRNYADGRFAKMNDTGSRGLIMVGPPPICEECVKIFAMGVLTESFVQRKPCPRHIGCTHSYRPVVIERLSPADIWVG